MAIVTADCFLGQTQEDRQLSIYEALLDIITDAGGSTDDMVTADCFLGLMPDFRLKAIYEALLGIADAVGGGGGESGNLQRSLVVAASDETTALTTGTAKVTFRVPSGTELTLLGIKASVTTAPAGSSLIVDVNVNGASVLSTKLSIDAGEETSVTAATPPVISNPSFPADAEVTIDIDQIGSGTAGAGLKVTFFF